MKRLAIVLVLTALVVGAAAVPASATIHEIVASFCSGRAVQDPPGVSDPTRENFVQALEATGVITGVVFDPALGGLVVQFDLSPPAAKFALGTGFTQVGETPDGIPIFVPNLVFDHPAFAHCRNLNP